MKKRLTGILLCMAMLFACVNFVFANETDTDIAGDTINKYVLPPVTLGALGMEYLSQVRATGVVNGKNYFYTCARSSAGILNVYNLDDNKLVATHKCPKGMYPWRMHVDSKGMVYMAGEGYLVKYDPYADKLYNLGRILGEWANFAMCIDDEDNVYIGTWPNAKIAKYDAKTGEYIDLGVIDNGATYVRSLAYCNGYLYAGTFSDTARKLIRINKNNYSDKKEIKIESKYVDVNEIDWLYFMDSFEDIVFVNAQMKNGYSCSNYLFVYDTVKEEFLDIDIKDPWGLPSKPYNGMSYLSVKGRLNSFNFETHELKDMDFACPRALFGESEFITLNDKEKWPNPILVGEKGMKPVFMDLVKRETTIFEDAEVVGGNVVSDVIQSKGDEIFTTTPGSGAGGSYNIYTGEKKLLKTGGQADGSLLVGDKLYIGGYPAAYLYVTDLKTGENTNLGHIADNQSRPYALEYIEDMNMIFIGTFPEYGELGGVIAWYDLSTGEMNSIRNIIPNQSLNKLKYHDGLIYGSTTIYGGVGSTPTEKNAVIFSFDPKTKKIIKSFTPAVPGMTTVPAINGIDFDNDGNMWAIAGYNLFMVDFETGSISHHYNFGIDRSTAAHAYAMIFTKDDLLYTNINGLRVINLKDYTYKDFSDYTKNIFNMVMGADGNIYSSSNFYTSGTDFTQLMVWPVLNYEVTYNDLTWAKKLFSETNNLGLYIGNPLSYANGKIQYIDSSNEKVAPVVENGRTLVPLRFIAESLGADVSWDDMAQKATLKKGSLNVSVTINKSEIMVNDEVKSLDVPAQTKEGRTLLPLRAVADAFSKQVFWDDSGIIIISDKSLDLAKEETSFVNLYLKYYMHEDYLDEKLIAENAQDAKLIKITDFEEISKFSSEVIPNWTIVGDMNESNMVTTTTDVSFSGNKSLKIFEKENQEVGAKSDYIAVDPKKIYTLNYREMIESGRLYCAIEYFDSSKTSLGSIQNVNIVPKGKWTLIDTPILFQTAVLANASYIKIYFNKPYYFDGEGYIDSVVIYEKK